MNRTVRTLIVVGGFLLFSYLILLTPDSTPEIPVETNQQPFLWNQDERWEMLEVRFLAAREMDSVARADSIQVILRKIESIQFIDFETGPDHADAFFDTLEEQIFELGVFVAASPEFVPQMLSGVADIRQQVKVWSCFWDLNSRTTRDLLYRLLYGSRIAVEEVLLQCEPESLPALQYGVDEASACPSAELLGVTIHSGDILVSRGGAATSALIARGNDYPGNFSHIALAHVDKNSGKLSIIESHIEVGVAVADLDTYLRDKKLRVMVLRPRSYLPELLADPLLPHKAASLALGRALSEHIPYDFSMDYRDNSRLFCSEVASDPYRQQGLELWTGISRISSPGVRSWLAAFGVEHFETQEPSDLEYDPQLVVVAEWRDPATLWKDHLDNAAIDVMLEDAERGERLSYNWYMLPFGRLAKAYSAILNLFGKAGPVPEGMSATSALTNEWFTARHNQIVSRLEEMAEEYRIDHGYRPPYWDLIKLARTAKTETD